MISTPISSTQSWQHAGVHPTTSQPSPDVFATLYRTLLADPDDHVVGLHISSKMSGTLQSATLAAQEFDPGRIHLVDTESVSGGLQLLVRAALDDIKAGDPPNVVAEKATRRRSKVTILVLLDTLTYLHRGGRIGRAQAFVGGLLNVKPLIGVRDGEVVPLARLRSRSKGIDMIVEHVRACLPLRSLAEFHAAAAESMVDLEARLGAAVTECDRRAWTDRAGRRRVQRAGWPRSRLPRRGLIGQACHDGMAVSSHVVSLVTPTYVPLDLDLPHVPDHRDRPASGAAAREAGHQHRPRPAVPPAPPLRGHPRNRAAASPATGHRADGARPHSQRELEAEPVQEDGAGRGDPRGRRCGGDSGVVQPAVSHPPAAAGDGADGQRQGRDVEDRVDLSQSRLRARRERPAPRRHARAGVPGDRRGSRRASCARVSSRCSGSRPRCPTVYRRRFARPKA